MRIEEYEDLRDKIIQPLCDGLLAKYLDLSYSDDWSNRLHREYEQVRTYIRERMRNTGSETLRIDRHKVGASILIAIIDVRPILVPKSNNMPIAARNCNEAVAFKTGLAVVQSWAKSEAKKHSDNEALAIAKKKFQFPSSDDGLYTEHVYRGLYQAKRENKLDPFRLGQLAFYARSLQYPLSSPILIGT